MSEYLPQTIDNYLTLPRAYANSHVVSNGKTAGQLLGDQLDLIDEKMKEIADAIARDDVGKLLAQGRFLEERFGRNTELASAATRRRRACPRDAARSLAAAPDPAKPTGEDKAVAKH